MNQLFICSMDKPQNANPRTARSLGHVFCFGHRVGGWFTWIFALDDGKSLGRRIYKSSWNSSKPSFLNRIRYGCFG